MTEDSRMIWCGRVEANERHFHACVYVTGPPPLLYARVRDSSKGYFETFEVDLNGDEPNGPLSEIWRILRRKTRTIPS